MLGFGVSFKNQVWMWVAKYDNPLIYAFNVLFQILHIKDLRLSFGIKVCVYILYLGQGLRLGLGL